MLFGTPERIDLLQGKELNIFVNGSYISTTVSYKYLGIDLDPNLNLSLHLDRIHRKVAGRVDLLRSIRSLLDQKSEEEIYKTMILPIFIYCGTLRLDWSDFRKGLTKNVELRSSKIINNSNLQLPSIDK